MQRKLAILIFAATFVFSLTNAAIGCAVITVRSLTKFDTSEYIFVGEVVGVADPVKSEKFHGEAWGVKVRVKESLNLPTSPAQYFVVIPFDLESDCKDKGQSKDKLLAYFPVGSHLRVIAKESRYVPAKMSDGNVRLEILPNNLGSIARNFSDSGKQVASVSSIYDYKSYAYRSPCGISQEEMPDYESNMLLPEFEFRKELFRLRRAKSDLERVEILKRMVYFPSSDNDYFEVVTQFIRYKSAVKKLIREREAGRQSFLSRLVLSC